MNYKLDIRTLSLTSGIISLILCICMFYVYQNRKTYSGFTQWTIASLLNFLGLVFLSLRGFLPDFTTIVMANTLIVAASGLNVYGIELFAGSTSRKWLFVAPSVSLLVSFCYFTYYSPSVNARIVIISLIISIIYLYCAYIINSQMPRSMGSSNALLVVVFSLLAIWLVLRIISTVFVEGPVVDFMQASAVQGVTIIVFWIGNIFIIIGLILLNFQKVEIELLASMDEIKTLRGIIPICASCKKIRNDKGIWEQIETYIRDHSDAEFSHGICPECMQELYPELIREDEK